jgi:organic radical activating enzyme
LIALHVKIMDCNGACRSCYERRIRKTQGSQGYDLEAMLTTLQREAAKETLENRRKHSAPCVHGGEPLMFKPGDLRTILKTMFDLYGRTGIQTNGTLMTDEHLGMFKEFKTSVGVSIDGDTAALNRGRRNDIDLDPRLKDYPLIRHDLTEMEKTGTVVTMNNMARAKAAGLDVSVIVVLRRYNAAPDRLDELVRFLLRLEKMGIRSLRTNEVIVFENRFRDEELTEAGVTGISESAVLNTHNVPFTITADVEVGDAGGEGVLVAIGGLSSGWSLYVKDGKPTQAIATAIHLNNNWYPVDLTNLRLADGRCSGSLAVTFRADDYERAAMATPFHALFRPAQNV